MKGAGDGSGGMQEIILNFKGCRSKLKTEFWHFPIWNCAAEVKKLN